MLPKILLELPEMIELDQLTHTHFQPAIGQTFLCAESVEMKMTEVALVGIARP